MALEYGSVIVFKGRHKGKIGYYDDDSDCDKALVYLGEPFKCPYTLINHEYIRNVRVDEKKVEAKDE